MQQQLKKILDAYRNGTPVYTIRNCRMLKCIVRSVDVYSSTHEGDFPSVYVDLVDVDNSLEHYPIEDISDILFENQEENT